jgi:hypothetical protein
MHLDAMGLKRQLSWSIIWTRLVTSPDYHHFSPDDVILASRLSLTITPPSTLRGWHLFAWAWALFATCALLVIGTELTIQWNYITNVQNIRTVGQLIPATIGVGGLARVVYSALFEEERNAEEKSWEERACIGQCKRNDDRRAWKEVGEGWKRVVRWLERRESMGLSVDGEKGKGKEKEKEDMMAA